MLRRSKEAFEKTFGLLSLVLLVRDRSLAVHGSYFLRERGNGVFTNAYVVDDAYVVPLSIKLAQSQSVDCDEADRSGSKERWSSLLEMVPG